MEYGFEWIQALIESEHCFRGETVVMNCHLCRGEGGPMERIGAEMSGSGTIGNLSRSTLTFIQVQKNKNTSFICRNMPTDRSCYKERPGFVSDVVFRMGVTRGERVRGNIPANRLIVWPSSAPRDQRFLLFDQIWLLYLQREGEHAARA